MEREIIINLNKFLDCPFGGDDEGVCCLEAKHQDAQFTRRFCPVYNKGAKKYELPDNCPIKNKTIVIKGIYE